MPSAEYTHSVTVDTPPDGVWASLQSAETWADIGPVDRVWAPMMDEGILMGYSWATDIGGRAYEGSARTLEHERPRSLGLQPTLEGTLEHERPSRFSMELDAGEMAGTIAIVLAENDNGTHLEVSLVIESRGMLSSLFFPAIRSAIGSGFPQQVEGMAAHLGD